MTSQETKWYKWTGTKKLMLFLNWFACPLGLSLYQWVLWMCYGFSHDQNEETQYAALKQLEIVNFGYISRLQVSESLLEKQLTLGYPW